MPLSMSIFGKKNFMDCGFGVGTMRIFIGSESGGEVILGVYLDVLEKHNSALFERDFL